MKDIELLFAHGIHKIYMITSELNSEGNEFILMLADMIAGFNSKQDQENKITWFGANYLLNFTVEEFQHLYSSGFTGGWFDITALDDDNARDMRTPYRNESVVEDLKSYAQVKRILDHSEIMNEDINMGVSWTMFMGNSATTIETIRNTIRNVNREGISQLYDSYGLSTNIRVFDYESPTEETLMATYSITEELKRTNYQQQLPSFAYPPALLKEFSETEINAMFKYLGETFLSTKYTKTRDWQNFYEVNAGPQKISKWLLEIAQFEGSHQDELLIDNILGSEETTDCLAKSFSEESFQVDNVQAIDLNNLLFSYCFEDSLEYFISLDLPSSIVDLTTRTPYDIAKDIYSRWISEDDFHDEIVSQSRSYSPAWKQDLLQFCVQAILYKFNIVIKAKYKVLFG